LMTADVYPNSAVQWFINVIDWLREWACARKTGLGTPLPWSPGWIVETLSDSTIYMAFYTINKHINEYGIKPEQLTSQVFDYVFFGKGDVKKVAEASKISHEILDSIREEFLYWYPVDMRNSAKELVPNHLTFFLFHHVALFPPEHLPKAIGVNGMLMIRGKPMHKSKGNFVTLRDAIRDYGADATRCALLLAAEDMDDPDWRSENVRDVSNKLKSFYDLANNIIETREKGKFGHLEEWLLSRLQHKIEKITENIELMKTRTAVENAFFEVWNDFRWYIRRKEKVNSKALEEALETWTRLLAPFAPHVCEEVWKKMKKKGFVSLAEWPTCNKNKVNIKAEETESLIETVLEDTANILRATKMQPNRICYYSAAPWKWRVYIKALDKSMQGRVVVSDLMKGLMRDPELRKIANEVAKFTNTIISEISEMSEDRKQGQLEAKTIDEHQALKEAEDFLKREFNAEISAYREDDPKRHDPKKKAPLARPYRPAIFIE